MKEIRRNLELTTGEGTNGDGVERALFSEDLGDELDQILVFISRD